MSDASLEKKANEAALIRQMAQTEGFRLLQAKFEEKKKKALERLLDMNLKDEEVSDIRKKIFIWTEITNMMKSIIITGDYSSKLLSGDFDSQTLGFKAEQGE